MSWPTYTVGAFFMALLIYDIGTNDWIDVPFHALIGLVLTGVYMLISMFISETIAGAALLIPAVALLGFMVSAWMSGESLKSRGCCVRCGDDNRDEEEEVEESSSTESSSTGHPSRHSVGTYRSGRANSGSNTGAKTGVKTGANATTRSSDLSASGCPNKLNATPLV